jgi:hypothetical protein
MVPLYLGFNAFIYMVFGVWCAAGWRSTTRAQGFLSLDSNGICEYQAVYGGMELGFAAFYLIAALKPEFQRAALLFSLLMYAGLVLFRWAAIALHSPVSGVTKVLAGLELLLLAGAAALYFRSGAAA